MTQLTSDVSKSIQDYVKRSISVIKPMLEMTSGSGSEREVIKSLQTASSASYNNVKTWLDSVSAIQKESSESMKTGQMSALKTARKSAQSAMLFTGCVAMSEIPGGISKEEYINDVNEYAIGVTDKDDLNKMVLTYSFYKKFDDFIVEWNRQKKPFPIKLRPIGEKSSNESYHYTIKEFRHLNESSIDSFDDEGQLDTKSDEPVNYDKIYEDLFNYISRAIASAIGSRENWLCFKDVRQNMDNLVKGADEEITKKIEIVCKTGGQKSLVHWPFKAEGLKGMWKRYMSELQLRINNRIDQLTGSRGSVQTGSSNMVEDFLTVTYPQIIAMMLTYKCVFDQLSEQYRRNFIPNYTFEDIEDIEQECEAQFSDWVRCFQNAWQYRDQS